MGVFARKNMNSTNNKNFRQKNSKKIDIEYLWTLLIWPDSLLTKKVWWLMFIVLIIVLVGLFGIILIFNLFL